MLVIGRNGLISVLRMTLCFVPVCVHSSDHIPADITNEQENYAIKVIHNTHNISEVEMEIVKPKMTTIPEDSESSDSYIKMQHSLKEYSNTENATVQENHRVNVILNKMQKKEIEEEYNNDINTNLKNWTQNQRNEWHPPGIGVATWYEISLTGKKVQQTGEDRVERGIHPHASTSKAVTLGTISEIGILLAVTRMILF